MGRRSQHTQEELRELILIATRRCVEVDGIDQPSAREIARAIGYAPGTLYNMFANLSEILLRVEARIFAELDNALSTAENTATDEGALSAYVETYVRFATENKRSWTLICKHQPDIDTPLPTPYVEALHAVVTRLERALERNHQHIDDAAAKGLARQIWMSVHGVIQIAMTQKIGSTNRSSLTRTATDLVEGLILVHTARTKQAPLLRRNGGRGQQATPADKRLDQRRNDDGSLTSASHHLAS